MTIELDLRRVLFILWKRVWVLILFMAILGGAAFSFSKWFMTKRYSASVSMYVYNQENRSGTSITSGDLLTSQKLVGTYIVILKSNSVLDQVSERLGGICSSSELRKMLTASSINDTEAFSVTITNTDPELAQKIANTIADVVPSEIKRVVKAGAVEVIDYAVLPDKPTSPNIAVNTAAGIAAGLVLAVILVLVLEMTDTAVRSEEDLTEIFEIPVLGVIPRLYGENGGR